MRPSTDIQGQKLTTVLQYKYHKNTFRTGGAIGVVKRMTQTLKRGLGIMRIDETNTSYKLPSGIAEIKKTLRITPHGLTKISPFEAQIRRKPNTPVSLT